MSVFVGGLSDQTLTLKRGPKGHTEGSHFPVSIANIIDGKFVQKFVQEYCTPFDGDGSKLVQNILEYDDEARKDADEPLDRYRNFFARLPSQGGKNFTKIRMLRGAIQFCESICITTDHVSVHRNVMVPALLGVINAEKPKSSHPLPDPTSIVDCPLTGPKNITIEAKGETDQDAMEDIIPWLESAKPTSVTVRPAPRPARASVRMRFTTAPPSLTTLFMKKLCENANSLKITSVSSIVDDSSILACIAESPPQLKHLSHELCTKEMCEAMQLHPLESLFIRVDPHDDYTVLFNMKPSATLKEFTLEGKSDMIIWTADAWSRLSSTFPNLLRLTISSDVLLSEASRLPERLEILNAGRYDRGDGEAFVWSCLPATIKEVYWHNTCRVCNGAIPNEVSLPHLRRIDFYHAVLPDDYEQGVYDLIQEIKPIAPHISAGYLRNDSLLIMSSMTAAEDAFDAPFPRNEPLLAFFDPSM